MGFYQLPQLNMRVSYVRQLCASEEINALKHFKLILFISLKYISHLQLWHVLCYPLPGTAQLPYIMSHNPVFLVPEKKYAA